MAGHEILIDALYFLAATITFVPIFKALSLGPIPGYLVAGIFIGPSGLGLIDNHTTIFQFSELGIIILLFLIGLEMSFARLKTLRKKILIDGGVQVLLTSVIFFSIASYLKLPTVSSLIIGFALSLSSTAVTLFHLKETNQLTQLHGQSTFGVLLLQDLALVPILAILPFLSGNGVSVTPVTMENIFFRGGVLIGLVLIGKFAILPLIRIIAKQENKEVFSATCLFLIISMSLGMERIGLSKALGAFLAGIFLSKSEFRHEIQLEMGPYKGMLMGVFFMAFGLEFNLNFLWDNLASLAILLFGLTAIKLSILFAIGAIRFSHWRNGLKFGLLMANGGEFGLVVLNDCFKYKILPQEVHQIVFTLVLISILLSPLIIKISDSMAVPQSQSKIP